jgi:glycine betaine/proline transport system ATP-binding protein
MAAVRSRGVGKAEVLSEYGCIVGIAGVSLDIPAGEIFCIMGLSGSGKSTLLRHLNRLIEPTAGKVRVLGRDITALGERELRDMRARHIGMVFQHMALLPHRSVRDNVAFPLEVRGECKSRRWEISQHALSLVNLGGFEDRMPSELSGGMQQRVGLARALASDPAVLLMDEPFSALDPLIRRQLQDQFLELSRRLKKTTVFVTHDLDEAIRLGNRIAIMKDGEVVQVGAPQDIVARPATEYVADFVRNISKVKFTLAGAVMEDIAGWQGEDLGASPRVAADDSLDRIIGIAAGSRAPLVVTDAAGQSVGVISKDMLLKKLGGDEAQ